MPLCSQVWPVRNKNRVPLRKINTVSGPTRWMMKESHGSLMKSRPKTVGYSPCSDSLAESIRTVRWAHVPTESIPCWFSMVAAWMHSVGPCPLMRLRKQVQIRTAYRLRTLKSGTPKVTQSGPYRWLTTAMMFGCQATVVADIAITTLMMVRQNSCQRRTDGAGPMLKWAYTTSQLLLTKF